VITRPDYMGLPASQRDALEAISQVTVEELFSMAQQVWDRISEEGKRSFGDHDTTMTAKLVGEPTRNGSPFKRLSIRDHSAGWWAVLQWAHPYKTELGVTDFWFHAGSGHTPAEDWEVFPDDQAFGRCRLHMQARRDNTEDPWTCSTHTLDFKHPLLYILHLAVGELDEDQS